MLTAKTKLASKWLLTGCATAALFSTGCRTGMPGMNLFGMRGEPSPEALAGSGPTTTYPAPPSDSATPNAIASIAGGTGLPISDGDPEITQVADSGGTTPSFASADATNFAAAQANGFNPIAPPPGSEVPDLPAPSDYAFGSKAFTPKSGESTTPPAATDSAYAKSTSFAPPDTGFAAPDVPAAIEPPNASGGGGFTLPSGIGGDLASAIAPQTSAPIESPAVPPSGFAPPSNLGTPADLAATTDVSPPAGFEAPTSFAPPAAEAPDFSTASAANAVTAPSTAIAAPSTTTSTPSTSLSTPLPSHTPNGYAPGSTAAASSYPAGSLGDGGSVYR